MRSQTCTDVVIEGQKDALEVFGLHTLLLGFVFVVKDGLDLGETLHESCHLVSEETAKIVHRIVGILHDIMEKSGHNRLVPETDIAYHDFGYSYRVDYIWLPRASSDSFVGFIGELEGEGLLVMAIRLADSAMVISSSSLPK